MGVIVREKPTGSGVWWVFIHHNGKRKAKKIGMDKKTAQQVAKQIEARLVLGDTGLIENAPPCPTFKEYAEQWLHNYIKNVRREGTYTRYKCALERQIYPAIGKMNLIQIKRKDIKTLLLGLHNRGLSKSSISTTRIVISGIMTSAIEDEIIQLNPATGMMKQLNLKPEKGFKGETLNQDEVSQFLKTCLDHYPEYYPLFLTAFRTGLRHGELLALEWGNIDWNKKVIWIKQSFREGKVGPTKSGKHRKVDMSDQLVIVLKELYTKRKLEAVQAGRGDEIVEIIFHRNNEHIKQSSLQKVFKRILRRAGIREIRIHDIRHTYASILLSAGVSPVYVKEQLGHTSIQITVDTYGHLIPSDNSSAVNLLDGVPAATKRNLYATKETVKVVNS